MLKSLIGLVVLVAAIVGAVALLGGSSDEAETVSSPTPRVTASPSVSPGTAAQSTVVTFTAAGFEPRQVTVKAGQRLEFRNQSGRPVQPSSDPHPQHTTYEALNLGRIADGRSGTTDVLDRVGTWTMHDHFDPSKTLTVIVQ